MIISTFVFWANNWTNGQKSKYSAAGENQQIVPCLGFQFPRTIRTVTRTFSPLSVGFMALGYLNKKISFEKFIEFLNHLKFYLFSTTDGSKLNFNDLLAWQLDCTRLTSSYIARRLPPVTVSEDMSYASKITSVNLSIVNVRIEQRRSVRKRRQNVRR